MRNEVIKLIVKVANGATVTDTKYTVFADKKSATRSEFYAAYQVGLNIKYVFEISTDDWLAICAQGADPVEVEYNSKTYHIIRSYEKYEYTEVVCG